MVTLGKYLRNQIYNTLNNCCLQYALTINVTEYRSRNNNGPGRETGYMRYTARKQTKQKHQIRPILKYWKTK